MFTSHWRRCTALLAALVLLCITASSALADESPAFDSDGFAALATKLSDRVGAPLTQEFGTPEGTMQLTTTGALYWHQSTGTLAYTDGHNRAALLGNRIVEWTGEAVDPPIEVAAPPVPVVTNSRVACIEWAESQGKNVPNAHGSGAGGVMQYLPGTFARGAGEMGHPEWSLWVPWQAEAVAAHDLALGRRSQWTVAGC